VKTLPLRGATGGLSLEGVSKFILFLLTEEEVSVYVLRLVGRGRVVTAGSLRVELSVRLLQCLVELLERFSFVLPDLKFSLYNLLLLLYAVGITECCFKILAIGSGSCILIDFVPTAMGPRAAAV
jgi:hypothetical protein